MSEDKKETLEEFTNNFREEVIRAARENPIAAQSVIAGVFGGLTRRLHKHLPVDVMFLCQRQPGKTTSMQIIKGREGQQMYHMLEMDFCEMERRLSAQVAAHLAERVDSLFQPLPVSFSEPAKLTDFKRAVKRTPNTGPKRRW